MWSCVEIEPLKILPFQGLQEGESPSHSSRLALDQPARHTPDLNGQPAVQADNAWTEPRF